MSDIVCVINNTSTCQVLHNIFCRRPRFACKVAMYNFKKHEIYTLTFYKQIDVKQTLMHK